MLHKLKISLVLLFLIIVLITTIIIGIVRNEQLNQEKLTKLLENSSEIITVYNSEGIITYESPSLLSILGYEPEEQLGKTIFTENSSFTTQSIQALFKSSLENPSEIIKIDIPVFTKDNKEIWFEASCKNLIDDKSIEGIVVNFVDITHRIKAKEEQKHREELQAVEEELRQQQDYMLTLSEEMVVAEKEMLAQHAALNNAAIVSESDKKGVITYVNKAFCEISGYTESELIGQPHNIIRHEDMTPETFKDLWATIGSGKIWRGRVKNKKKNGDFYWVVAIITPVLGDDGKPEKYIGVRFDITDQVYQEELIEGQFEMMVNTQEELTVQGFELESAHKSITDSINYAKRIQQAIIPSIEEIRSEITGAFMFYLPKDVVSGDFPYYFKKGDYIYLAVVDCTGHGVPGAMMSLIGHLLLNDILNDEKILTPSEVLTKLHWGVVKTLKQDGEGNKTSDGMDVALCRINMTTNELVYSGAHRPLFHLREEELTQVKGDKFPIGGCQYGGKNNYSDQIIQIQKGDRVLFFSDGYPDQFGGEKQLKLGSKRIRAAFSENTSTTIDESANLYKNKFSDWMGESKQIDDVLLIGINF